MGKIGAFLNLGRAEAPKRAPAERIGDVREFVGTLPLAELRGQASRCMECGVPFCHPRLSARQPDPRLERPRLPRPLGRGERAAPPHEQLPRVHGPPLSGPCEAACVLEINEGDAVTIKQVELAIVDRAWAEGWIVPRPAACRPAAGSP
jgi:glutamate synthase (NADPH/NADH) small chain